MFYQPSLFGSMPPARFDPTFAAVSRVDLDSTSWIEYGPGWLTGADQLFDELTATLPFDRRRGIEMYDRMVDEPRATAAWFVESGSPEPATMVAEMRVYLSRRYRERFESIGFNLYEHATDSVAWHADRVGREVSDPVVVIVSLGAPRPFRLRPRSRNGGRPMSWSLGHGDLFVMGGACQHTWEHTVPKVRLTTGPRMSITFRPHTPSSPR